MRAVMKSRRGNLLTTQLKPIFVMNKITFRQPETTFGKQNDRLHLKTMH
ncbi:MAG: hypothetical protein IJV35_06975 [Neisseriaceae bacterium]|nr:hypothetical protein [Neisseriaceae bacterium]